MLALLFVFLVLFGAWALVGRRRPGRAGGSFGGPVGFFGSQNTRVADARADAQSWVDRLGGQVMMLNDAGNASARQALADAAERHQSAVGQLHTARSEAQFGYVTRTAVEGLHYIRAARTALGLDPGPALPPQADTSSVAADVRIEGQTWRMSPYRDDTTPYYYAGGQVGGRYAPAGWYSQPWWRTALIAGAAGAGGMLLMDSLLDGFGPHHHGGFGGLGGGDFGGGDFGGGDFGGGGF
jgi:uncharacterized membrane protein YgcG